jgi:hypothetical protein
LLVQLVPCRCDRFRALGRTSVSSLVYLAQDSGRTAQDSAHGFCTERTGPREDNMHVDGGGEDALCDSGSEYDLATHTRDHLTHANHSRDAAPAGSLISLWIGAIFRTRLCRTSTRTHGHAHGMVPSVHASNRPTPGFWTQWRICHSCAF